MHELIKYIGDILNIKTESVYTIQDMTEELSQIKDIGAYRSYIKDNLAEIEYKTGFQKFLILTQNYLQLEYLAINPEAKTEVDSIISVAHTVVSHGKFNDLIQYYGTQEDKNLLRSIGASKIQRLLDDNTIGQEITKRIKSRENPEAYEQLPQRLSKMIGDTARDFKC